MEGDWVSASERCWSTKRTSIDCYIGDKRLICHRGWHYPEKYRVGHKLLIWMNRVCLLRYCHSHSCFIGEEALTWSFLNSQRSVLLVCHSDLSPLTLHWLIIFPLLVIQTHQASSRLEASISAILSFWISLPPDLLSLPSSYLLNLIANTPPCEVFSGHPAISTDPISLASILPLLTHHHGLLSASPCHYLKLSSPFIGLFNDCPDTLFFSFSSNLGKRKSKGHFSF